MRKQPSIKVQLPVMLGDTEGERGEASGDIPITNSQSIVVIYVRDRWGRKAEGLRQLTSSHSKISSSRKSLAHLTTFQISSKSLPIPKLILITISFGAGSSDPFWPSNGDSPCGWLTGVPLGAYMYPVLRWILCRAACLETYVERSRFPKGERKIQFII
jgi:hypothetical protein